MAHAQQRAWLRPSRVVTVLGSAGLALVWLWLVKPADSQDLTVEHHDAPARLLATPIDGSRAPGWHRLDFFAATDTVLLARNHDQAFLFEIGSNGSASVVTVLDPVPPWVVEGSGGDLPSAVMLQLAALQELGLEIVSSWYSAAGTERFTLRPSDRTGVDWRVEVADERGGIAGAAFSLRFADPLTPEFEFWDGRRVELFEGGRFYLGYSYPFRFDAECQINSIWSDLFPQEAYEQQARDDLTVFCAGTRFRIPLRGRYLEGIIVGFDGSLSMVAGAGEEWFWYRIE
ncbi:MAG: hypothetical protein AAF657_25700 [Acidobacteriota bacterium]